MGLEHREGGSGSKQGNMGKVEENNYHLFSRIIFDFEKVSTLRTYIKSWMHVLIWRCWAFSAKREGLKRNSTNTLAIRNELVNNLVGKKISHSGIISQYSLFEIIKFSNFLRIQSWSNHSHATLICIHKSDIHKYLSIFGTKEYQMECIWGMYHIKSMDKQNICQ